MCLPILFPGINLQSDKRGTENNNLEQALKMTTTPESLKQSLKRLEDVNSADLIQTDSQSQRRLQALKQPNELPTKKSSASSPSFLSFLLFV